MKRLLFLLLFLNLIIVICSSCYAYTPTFEYMLSVMEVPLKNASGKMINEDIYDKYSLFVYGSPEDEYAGQRWKDVENGLWNNGKTQGEYWILGENYNGYLVHNHKFPADIEPPTSPETWRYAVITNAKSSWQDQSKYMDDYQRDYMLNSKLMRNDNTYNITALDIGLDKVRLENYATWKTKGSVYTERYDKDNKRWAANFMVPPMNADSKIVSFAKFPDGDTYYVPSGESEVTIPITFGAEVVDLSDYARQEHVKEIKSEIYINNVLIDEVSDTEKLSISKEMIYTAYKPVESDVLILNVEVKSHLTTKFTTDGALVDIKKYTIIIYFGIEEEEEIIEEDLPEDDYIEPDTYNYRVRDVRVTTGELLPPPEITSIKIYRLKNGAYQDLLRAKKTGQEFVCAGETIRVEVTCENQVDTVLMLFDGNSSIFTFDAVTKKVEWDEPRERHQKTFLHSLDDFKRMYAKKRYMIEGTKINDFYYDYIIPYETKQTLHSWKTLRDKSDNAFSIDESKLFKRINEPYEIVIQATGVGGTTTKRISLDVFERWDTLYNRDISKYVISS